MQRRVTSPSIMQIPESSTEAEARPNPLGVLPWLGRTRHAEDRGVCRCFKSGSGGDSASHH